MIHMCNNRINGADVLGGVQHHGGAKGEGIQDMHNISGFNLANATQSYPPFLNLQANTFRSLLYANHKQFFTPSHLLSA